jgi:hypothetical protein
MIVKLNWAEIAMCAGVGVRRKVESLRTSLSPLHKFDAHGGFEIDIQGACGEYAVAKALGLAWNGSVGSFKLPDVGPYQVRTKVSTNYQGLALRTNDKDDEITILVEGRVPNFELKGWICNANGKQKRFEKVIQSGRPPAFLVPPAELHSIESLPPTSSPASRSCVVRSRKRPRSSAT